MDAPLPEWSEHTCGVCPAQELGPGRFDVVDRPGPEFAYNRAAGWRVDPDGNPVCVHPYRVGMPPGRYASAGVPLPDLSAAMPAPTPAALELPTELDDLEGWLVATLRVAAPEQMFTAVARAERQAGERFAPGVVVKALRRVLSIELANR
ncbi:hypothetical protein BDK92_2751 [Micromonospora pisi]|uniref:Uncharacterized protein n=1 Tax=Micromonospora pisi TaxID=589240 RepID=A0A495JHQ4_9ACTN|nr:hypothetical protein [Micromonospora pisi]RKR88427.1 hypothetical protein BDK92_2751 [Micromonospora pisi]